MAPEQQLAAPHPSRERLACIGAGLVGSAWAIVFARAGFAVSLYDSSAVVLASAPQRIREQLDALHANGLLDEPAEAVAARVCIADSLAQALQDVAYVQESILERAELKRALLQEIEALDDGRLIVGSSTSGIPASAFASRLKIAARVLVVHPVNPPSLIPLVELVPSPDTSSAALAFARQLMQACRQSPITVNREIDGFVLNRLQAVLLREAWSLVKDGIASTEDVDKTVRDGLGWRWSFMGPFETIDLNAVGGVADYARRLGPLYQRIAASRDHGDAWDEAWIDQVEAQRRERLAHGELPTRAHWRDLRLMAFARHLREVGGSEDVQNASA